LDNLQRVGAEAGNDYSADCLCTGFIECAPAVGRPEIHFCDISNADRNIVLDANHGFFNIFNTFDIPQATDVLLHQIDFHRLGPNVEIGIAQGFHHFLKGNPQGPHSFRVNVYLVLPDEPTY